MSVAVLYGSRPPYRSSQSSLYHSLLHCSAGWRGFFNQTIDRGQWEEGAIASEVRDNRFRDSKNKYSLGQHSLRMALDRAKQTIDNQVGKPTAKPTLRWVFQCFMSIHLLTVNGVKQITNLTLNQARSTIDLSVFDSQDTGIIYPIAGNL